MSLFNKRNKIEQRQFFPYFETVFNSGTFTVEHNLAVDNAVSRISNTISILPLKLYTYTKNGKTEAWWHNVSVLLKDPAVEESAEIFYKTLIRNMLCSGNAYIYKHRKDDTILSLELIDPTRVKISRRVDGAKLYSITGERGGVFSDLDIIHIPYYGEGYNGTKGKSPTEVHKEVITRNDLISEYMSIFFKNGIGSRLLVELGDKYEIGSPKMEKLLQEFKAYFNSFVLGPSNAGQPVITPPGTKLGKIEQSSNIQADVFNLYKESCNDVYRMFNIPPEVMDSSQSKYGSLEQKNQDFLNTCIMPLCVHISQMMVKGLLSTVDKASMFIEFDYKGLLEVDTNKKLDYYRNGFLSGIFSLNEVREALNVSAVDNSVEGSTHWIPSNLIPLTEENIHAILAKSKNEMMKTAAEKQEDKFADHNGSVQDKNI